MVRLGIVGLAWGAQVAEAARDLANVRIDACHARSESARNAFATQFGCRPVSEYEALLADPSLAGVVIVTPNGTHRELAVAALSAGKHVLVTKPIATTMADASEMLSAARSAHRILAVSHQSRRQPVIRSLKRLFDRGMLGRPILFEANTSSPTGLSLPPESWRQAKVECPGGPLLQLGIHYIDNAQYLFGPVRAVASLHVGARSEEGPPETTVTWLGFADGAVGTLVSSYVTASRRWIRVSGETGSATLDSARGLVLEAPGREPELLVPPAQPESVVRESLAEEVAEFAACIRTGKAPEVDGHAGARNLAVVLAAVESSRTGRVIEVETLLRGTESAHGGVGLTPESGGGRSGGKQDPFGCGI